MNFREYIYKRPILNNTSGDFIKGAREDTELPLNPGTWNDLKSYLKSKERDEEFLTAGRRVFRSYRDYVKRLEREAAALN